MSVDWDTLLRAAGIVLAALLAGYVINRLLRSLSRRARMRRDKLAARIVDVVAPPASIALPLVLLAIASGLLPLPSDWLASVRHALGIGAMLCLTWLGVRAVGAIANRIIVEHPVDVADNLAARRIQTQTRVIGRIAQGGIALLGLSFVLMTFPAVRQVGTTLLASAGVVGLVAGIAAKPVFGNLIAGLQIALSQPIRLDDVVIVEGEWGRIEEITSAYVVVRIWDERRMVVPLQWFIEHPFQNWTRRSAELLGASMLWLDYRTPMDAVRAELQRICETDTRWDGRVCVAQIVETDRSTVQVRLLVSARNSGDLFDLRCAVRERMIDFLLSHHPEALPRMRANIVRGTVAPDPDRVRVEAADRRARAVATDTGSPGAEAPGEAPPGEPRATG
ncbi:MAG TPA: mechanosensitive ion channel family protein [Lysobacter sp.]